MTAVPGENINLIIACINQNRQPQGCIYGVFRLMQAIIGQLTGNSCEFLNLTALLILQSWETKSLH